MLILFQTKRNKLTLQISLPSVVRLHLWRHNLWIIMAKQWEHGSDLPLICSGGNMSTEERASPEQIWQSTVYVHGQSTSFILGIKYYLLESSHCPLDAMSPSEQYSWVLFIGKHQHTLVPQKEKSSILWKWSFGAVLNGWSLTTATAYYNSVWACVQQ